MLKKSGDVLEIKIVANYATQPAVCTIVCAEDNTDMIDLDGEWIEEYSRAAFILDEDQIDQVIRKLYEIRKYLYGK